jgi:sugar lactone lactonase YvrE
MVRTLTFVCALGLSAALALPTSAGAESMTLVGEWGSQGAGPGQFNLFTDLVVAPDGSVYTLENGNDRVQHFDANGQRLGGWGSTGNGAGQFQQPDGLAVSPSGEVSVVDSFLSRIQRFTADGTLNLTWGSLGSGPGQFTNPEGAAAFGASTVYVADRGNSQVDVYDVTTGATFVTSWGSIGSGPGQFQRPQEVAVDSAGNAYVTDRDNGRVQEFAPDGTYIREFGTKGNGRGQLSQPIDVSVDGQGNVWVADDANFKVVKFAPDGRVLADYDRVGGTRDIRPEAVSVSANGDVYIADVGISVPGPKVLRLSEAVPVAGKTVVAAQVAGTVLVKGPGSRTFVPLAGAKGVPVGSVLDTKKGTVSLTAASNKTGGAQTGLFYTGVFQVQQKAAAKPITDLVLTGGSFARCPRARGAASGASRNVRQLWGNATGKFRTRGRFSAATVRGTTWLTADRCDGTLTTVKAGSVSVVDFARHKTLVVKAGKSYLAKAPLRSRG